MTYFVSIKFGDVAVTFLLKIGKKTVEIIKESVTKRCTLMS